MATDGPNKGFVFHGLGSAMNQASTGSTFGGILFGYSTNEIRLFKPRHSDGYLINIGKTWGNQINTQQSDSGQIVVQAWHQGGLPSNCIGNIIMKTNESPAY